MRGPLLALLSAASLTLGMSAGAMPLATKNADVQAPSGDVQRVAEGCGRGYHWVERYRRGDGTWVPGHCAPN